MILGRDSLTNQTLNRTHGTSQESSPKNVSKEVLWKTTDRQCLKIYIAENATKREGLVQLQVELGQNDSILSSDRMSFFIK